MNRLTETQKSRNARRMASWDLFASHREKVTQLLTEKRSAENPTLGVLGAGNCNDLELKQLGASFNCIDLVDIDLDALQRGAAAQDCEVGESLHLHGNCDATGVWHALARHDKQAASDCSSIDKLIDNALAWPGLPNLGPFGTVASCCLLSQLIEGVISVLDESHPRCLDVIAAVRQRHLRLLHELTAPGGFALLITDFVSSDTAPTLPTLSGQLLSGTLKQMIHQHNFFTGLNPFRLQALLHEDPMLAGHIVDIRCETPWLWNFGPRYYAVTAISFRKKPAALGR